MGLNDAAEMLEVAKEDVVRLERQNASLRALIGRIGDHVRELPAADPRQASDYHFGRGLLAAEILTLVDTAAGRPDVSPMSGIWAHGVEQTWQQVAIDRESRLIALEPLLTMLADLDRNRNGRHEGDVDAGTVSLGNPHLVPGQVIGYSILGTHAYVVPDREHLTEPAAWQQKVRR